MSFLLKLFKNKVKQVNLTICGLDNAGKTTLINYLIHGEFRNTIPTSGMNREKINLPKLQLDIYDLGGQEEFRPMWSDYNEQSDGIVYVIDSADHDRFEISKEIFYDIIDTQINQNIPVLILLHKCDLPNGLSIRAFVDKFGLSNPDLEIKWAVFETSAKTGKGLIDSFQWLVNVFGGDP